MTLPKHSIHQSHNQVHDYFRKRNEDLHHSLGRKRYQEQSQDDGKTRALPGGGNSELSHLTI